MPTLNQGTVGSGSLSTATQLGRDVFPSIVMLEDGSSGFLQLLMKLRKKDATQAKIEWFENELLPRFDTLGASLSSSATSMTVTAYTRFRANDIVQVNDGELVRVTATPSTTTVSISRAVGETAAAAVDSGARLRILQPAMAEGSSSRALLSTQRSPQYNYLGIIRTPFGYTETARWSQTLGEPDKMASEAANALLEHKKDIEGMILFGERALDESGTHPRRMSRGLFKAISTNSLNANGPLTESVFDTWLMKLRRYGKKEKVAFLSPIICNAINGFAKDKLRKVDASKSYGLSITRYENAGGAVNIVEHNLLTNDSLSDYTGWGGAGVAVDLEDIILRTAPGRFARHIENIQTKGDDLRTDEYLSECGLECHQERFHGEIMGVTG